MFGELGVAVLRFAVAAAFQGFSHRPMQQHAAHPADLPIDHLANLVVAEVEYAALRLLVQQTALDQRLHRAEQLLLGLAYHLQEGVEVEAPAEDRGRVQDRADLFGHVG